MESRCPASTTSRRHCHHFLLRGDGLLRQQHVQAHVDALLRGRLLLPRLGRQLRSDWLRLLQPSRLGLRLARRHPGKAELAGRLVRNLRRRGSGAAESGLIVLQFAPAPLLGALARHLGLLQVLGDFFDRRRIAEGFHLRDLFDKGLFLALQHLQLLRLGIALRHVVCKPDHHLDSGEDLGNLRKRRHRCRRRLKFKLVAAPEQQHAKYLEPRWLRRIS